MVDRSRDLGVTYFNFFIYLSSFIQFLFISKSYKNSFGSLLKNFNFGLSKTLKIGLKVQLLDLYYRKVICKKNKL